MHELPVAKDSYRNHEQQRNKVFYEILPLFYLLFKLKSLSIALYYEKCSVICGEVYITHVHRSYCKNNSESVTVQFKFAVSNPHLKK